MLTRSSLAVLTVAAVAATAPTRVGAQPETSPSLAGPRARIVRWVNAPPVAAHAAAAAPSKIIFLNDCIAPHDCQLTPGGVDNDSRTNVSSVAEQPALLSPWRFTTTQWNNLVQCVQQVYDPFDVQIVTTEPPATTEYFEAMVAGRAAEIAGLPAGVVGVAPFNCDVIPNAITFSFANDYPDLGPTNAADLCWTVAQEIAHAFGLQHKYDARDPMTYQLPSLPLKLFVDDDGPCGTGAARNCTKGDKFEDRGCPGPSTMNSYRQIAALFGARPGTPPTLTVEQPTSGGELSRGFVVTASASDDVRLRDLTLTVDGVGVGTPLRAAPFEWRTSKTSPAGPHSLEVVATDFYGAQTKVALDVTVKADCTGAATGCDRDELCLDGRCIVGPGTDRGLGDTCSGSADCASGSCASAGEDKFCVEECVVEHDGCPEGFKCLTAAVGAVCWPNHEDGGCAASEDPGGLPVALGLAFAACVLMPRRRRPRARPR